MIQPGGFTGAVPTGSHTGEGMNTGTALIELPKCPHHGEMMLREPHTPEQAFCGTWYACGQCGRAFLFKSPELEPFYDFGTNKPLRDVADCLDPEPEEST